MSGPSDRSKRKHDRGFTLIELLIVIVIIGIIAALAIPNLLNALDRSRQKRTMADMRSIATQIEIYGIDNSYFPTASNVATVRSILEPLYAKELPDTDGWNHTIYTSVVATGYTIASEGKDGTGGMATCAGSPSCGDLNDSIIFVDGQFVQWPMGAQR